MKKLRVIPLLMALVLLLSLFVGCGAASDKGGYNGDFDSPATGSGIYENGAEKENSPVESGRKLIRTVSIRSETADQDALLADLESQVASMGGYVQSKSVNNNPSTRRSATLVLRIPADKLDEFVNHVEGATNILSANETAEDITLSYIATQSRIKALETEETRLLELLAQAMSLEEILLLESKLADVRTELEKHKSQLNVFNNLVDYATVNLDITEVKEYTVVEEEEPSAWQRISTGFVNSLKGAWNIICEMFIGLIIALPYLLLVALIPAIVLICIRIKNKKKKNKPCDEETQKSSDT